MLKTIIIFIISFNAYSMDFRTAKKHLKKYYVDKPSFYCNCTVFKGKPLFKECGYKSFSYQKRSKRIEFEHIVPSSRLGGHLPEWKIGHKDCKSKSGKKYKGRKCAEKVNKELNIATGDLHNLTSSLGSLNAIRSNFRMSIIQGEKREYGKCDFEVDKKLRLIEPPTDKMGDIARVYLYMAYTYKNLFTLSENELKMFYEWHKSDKVDKSECDKNKWAKSIQGTSNQLIEKSCN